MALLFRLFRNFNRAFSRSSRVDPTDGILEKEAVTIDLADNLGTLREIFSNTPDLVIRKFYYKQTGKQAALVYLSGLTDKNEINNNVLRPLMFQTVDDERIGLPVTVAAFETLQGWRDIEQAVLRGQSLLFVEGMSDVYSFDTQGWPQRSITDSKLETSLKGAHQGFIETGNQNIALIRRFLSSRELKIKELYVGSKVASKLSILYLEDVAHPKLLQELERRISCLNVACILNTGELAEYIEDRPFSVFPQFITTESPDLVASQLLQGRLCVVVDRSPSVLIAPVGFSSFFHGIDDYSTRWHVASSMRMLRFLAFGITAFLPAVYIALISFNAEIIPLDLILSIGEFRAAVPFPPFLEAVLMEIILEMLREAGIRLPAPLGQTVGIVGGIVIGQAAVQAGVVSNLMVVIVATTAVASFILPNYDMASSVRLIRFPMMILASMFGIIGILAGLMVLCAHLISLKSLGESFSAPIAPIRLADWKNTFVRLPLRQVVVPPKSVRSLQKRKTGDNQPGGNDP